jgi:DNA polymerase-1
LIAADYSQIEVRILAHVCQDPLLKDLFRNEQDIYRQLAATILSIPVGEVPDVERNKAKTICLGIIYGMGAASTAQKLGIELSAAHKIINSFFMKFKNVRKWMESIKR